jgi:hypothetical protein
MTEYKTFIKPESFNEYYAVWVMTPKQMQEYSPEDQEKIRFWQDWFNDRVIAADGLF